MAFENRKYVILTVAELSNISFGEVLETSAETCRYSVDGTKTFVKYDGAVPASLVSITNKSQEYSHFEILEILSTEEWSSPIESLYTVTEAV